MPQFKSETYVAQETAAGNAGKMIGSAELISGKSAFLQCKVVVPVGTALNDTILAGFLPSGMTVVPGAVLKTSVTSGAGTFAIGVEDNPTGIATVAVANSVGTALINTTESFKSTKRQAIVLTLNGALTAGGTFTLNFPLVNSN